MSQELNFDFTAWWEELSFPGKELFKVSENGALILLANNNIRERTIATLDPENANAVVKNLLEKFAAVKSKVQEVEIEWVATDDKQKLAEKVAQVKEYLHHVVALGDFETLALLVHDWEHTLFALAEENYANKLNLTEQAETLAESENWKETTQALRDIADKWKQVGYLDKNRNDKLWNRMEAARRKFHERKRLHHNEEEKDLLHNLDLKIDLVEQAEAIAASEEWKATTETFHRLTEEWKTIGHTMNKKNEELWHRFLAAKSAFFDKKREHYNKIQQELERNYTAKEILAEKAEALKDSKDWNTTTLALSALMEEWKKTGRTPQEKGDNLWKRFNNAQEQFFTAKKQHFEELKEIHDQNYNLKKELLARAEQIKDSTQWGKATAEMQQLLEEWKNIGPVARAQGDRIWETFNTARKHFFERLDANRKQQKQYLAQQKEARIEQAKNLVINLQQDIKEEEEKLADFKEAIQNITPGKKAAELRSHLETLISKSETTIKRLKDKFAQAENDIKVPEQ